MKVKALKLFNDLKSKKLRKAGEIFEVTPKRAEELNSSPHGVLIEVIEKETPKAVSQNVGGNKAKPTNQKRKS